MDILILKSTPLFQKWQCLRYKNPTSWLAGLVFFEKDLGTTIVLCTIFSAVYFAAGAKLTHIGAAVGTMVLIGAGAIFFAPWRVARMMAFLDPFAYADDEGYQVVQSLYAIGSGGVLGEGFAQGHQKLFYLF